MQRRSALAALATAALLSAPTRARALSLDEALELAVSHSPLVKRARAERQPIAALEVAAALRLPANPLLSVAGGAYRLGSAAAASASSPAAVGAEWSLHLEQAIEVAGQRGRRLAEVGRSLAQATERERLARSEAVARTRAAYVGALLGEQLVAGERHREGLTAELLASVRLRTATGASSEVELQLAEVEHGRAASARVAAEAAREQAFAQLRAAIAAPPDAPLQLTSALSPPAGEVPPLADLTAAALARRADLAALRGEQSVVDAGIARLRREAVPSVLLFVDAVTQPALAGAPSQLYVGGGVGFALPVVDRNQGKLAVAAAERSRVQTEIGLAEEAIRHEVYLARDQLLRRRDESQNLIERVVPAAERHLALVTEGWRAGKLDLFRVISAARDEAGVRRDHLGVLGLLWQAAISLDRATGAL